MTGPENYRRAGQLAAEASSFIREGKPGAAAYAAIAQVHATLALAAATALGGSGLESVAWRDAAGTTTAIPGENRPMLGESVPGPDSRTPARQGSPGGCLVWIA